MAIVRWRDPLGGMTGIRRDLDDVFSDLLSPGQGSNSTPAMDIYSENDKELVTEVHLPGFSPEDIEIRVEDNILEIKAEKQENEEHRYKRRNYMIRQSATSFYRSIALPTNIDQDNIKASFEDGVLRIRALLKQDEDNKSSRRITVNSEKKTGGRKKSGS